MKTAKQIGIALTASALMFSVSAQAATRSATAIPATTSVQGVELARTAAPTADESQLEGEGEGGILLALLAAAAVIAGIVLAASGNDSPG